MVAVAVLWWWIACLCSAYFDSTNVGSIRSNCSHSTVCHFIVECKCEFGYDHWPLYHVLHSKSYSNNSNQKKKMKWITNQMVNNFWVKFLMWTSFSTFSFEYFFCTPKDIFRRFIALTIDIYVVVWYSNDGCWQPDHYSYSCLQFLFWFRGKFTSNREWVEKPITIVRPKNLERFRNNLKT